MAKEGFYRIWHIIGDPKANQPIPPIIPVSRTTFLNGVKSGKYPKSVKIGDRITAWRVEDIDALVDSLSNAAGV